MLMTSFWQERISFSPDKLLIGTGWHEVEKDDDAYIRWTGPDPVATIHLSPRRDHPNRLNLTIHRFADETILRGLSLEADGLVLQTTIGPSHSSTIATAVLPEDSSKNTNEVTVLTLRLPRTLSAQQVPGQTKDNRKLGLALSRLDIFPLSRPLFTAQKYADTTPFDGICYIRHHPYVRDAVISGNYASAYDYFTKHNRVGEADACSLDAAFDERPGDLYDIIQDDLKRSAKALEQKYLDEVRLLREVVYRQGNEIQDLRKTLDTGSRPDKKQS
jgi:hypothetical protein